MTQCPFPSRPQVDTTLNFHALSEIYRCPNQFICLRSFPWDPNMRREQRVKIDVERRGITIPSIGQCRGIFYDPLRNRAAFSPEPVVALSEQSGTTFSERGIGGVDGQRKPKTKMRPTMKYHPYPEMSSRLPPMALLAPSIASGIGFSRAGAAIETQAKSQIDDDLVKLGKRTDDAQGLHYILVDLPDDETDLALVPIKEESCFMLLFDTGCPVTWVYGKPTQLLQSKPLPSNPTKALADLTGRNIERTAASRSFDWKTKSELAAGSTEIVEFADGLVTWLKLYKGRARVLKPGTGPADAYTMQEFKFAVCVAATAEKIGMQMDGILGMAHKTMNFGNANNSELLAWNLAQDKRLPNGPRFIVALDEDASNSWLVLNTGEAQETEVDRCIPHEEWETNWVSTVTSRLFHWVFNVVCFSTPDETHQVTSKANRDILLSMPFVVDTGTLYSYFPIEIYDSLRAQMRAMRTVTGQPYVVNSKKNMDRLKSIPFSVTFQNPKSTSKQTVAVKLGSLAMFVTQEPGPSEHTLLCSFLPGSIPARYNAAAGGPAYQLPKDEERPTELLTGPGGTLKFKVQSEPRELFIFGNYFLRHLVVEFLYGVGTSNTGHMRMARRIRD